MKKQILIQLLLLLNIAAFAQTMTVQGKVTDAKTAEAMIGVSVVVKGTSNGIVTDVDGYFTLQKVPPNAILVFSFVGSATQEVAVGSQQKINIVMEEETATFKELVVVGYGTQRRKIGRAS